MIEVTTGSAAERVEASLRRSIIALDVLPGTRLSEQEIAARHGVSRQPVREAFIGLSRTRLVEVRPQRGTVVTKISVSQLMQARFVREAIEIAVVRRACETFDPTSRRRIDDLLALQEERAAAGDHAGFQRADSLFHAALAEGAGCALAWEAVQDVKAHLDRACQLTLADAAAMLPLVEQHRAILAGIDARAPEEAEAALRHHLWEIVRALPRAEARYPDLFE
ncbi:GntR family transcriptional regulator [Methylobacterium sp. SyP6R]|uniref:GntR family transcriptional regulator n=1 Tax=Methylobacterium sp. SyP6R TaxID=2718876 RepID=UPI001F31D478|nr:GntR family transcriptional regulator [Methylobacterium sp. SyP6R]MCF4129487.1 GntR family transcriptional regulator [Methylobacterium sp. SyP6R]